MDLPIQNETEQTDVVEIPSEEPEQEITEITEVEEQEKTTESSEIKEPPVEIEMIEQFYGFSSFCEDRAWIKYKLNEIEYYGLVDTSGNVLLQIPTENASVTDYQNGYAYYKVSNPHSPFNTVRCTLDINGDVALKYETSNYKDEAHDPDRFWNIVLESDGYIITKKNISSFDSTRYLYTIYGPDGTVIEQFETKEEIDVARYGIGIFGFENVGYYCANGRKWLDTAYAIWQYSKENVTTDDPIIYQATPGDGSMEFTLLYSDGQTKAVVTDWYDAKYESYITGASPVTDGICVLGVKIPGYYYECVSVNFNTGEAFVPEYKYTEKMAGDGQVPNPGDGRIVLQLAGEDGRGYHGIFDYDFNLIGEPIPGINFVAQYKDSRLVVMDTISADNLVYDLNGNLVYSLTDAGYRDGFEPYSCGFLSVSKSEGNKSHCSYLDVNGEPLELNFNSVKTLSFDPSVTE